MMDCRAPVSEDRLRAAIDDRNDAWAQTFDVLFRDNPAGVPPFDFYKPNGFARLNRVQQQFVGFDIWYGRYLNGGFYAAFFDPVCSVAAAYDAIPILGWPEFENQLRRALEDALLSTRARILAAIEESDVWSAGKQLTDASRQNSERLVSEQVPAAKEFEAWYCTYEQQVELDRHVLASIWQHRSELIRPLH